MSISQLSEEHQKLILDGTEVPLQNGGHTIISNVDLPIVQEFKWYKSCNYVYCTKRSIGSLHRFILKPNKGEIIDHINGDPLDNRRENIRVATKSQNLQNARKRKNHGGVPTTSLYKGVCYDKKAGKWMANIRKRFIGYYSCAELAAMAYDKHALEEFGEYAALNNVKIGIGL